MLMTQQGVDGEGGAMTMAARDKDRRTIEAGAERETNEGRERGGDNCDTSGVSVLKSR